MRPAEHVIVVVVCFCDVNKDERIGTRAQAHVLECGSTTVQYVRMKHNSASGEPVGTRIRQ